MKKSRIRLGVTGLCLSGLLLATSCASLNDTQERQRRVVTIVEPTTVTVTPSKTRRARELVRQEAVPQLQVDALSVYRSMLIFFDPEEKQAFDTRSEAYGAYPAFSFESSLQEEPAQNNTDLIKLAKIFNETPEKLTLGELLELAKLYREGSEGYREVYEVAAYRFPENTLVQLNAAAASLYFGDKEAARGFLSHVQGDPRSYASEGVLALMDGDLATAESYFKKGMSYNPRLMRENLKIVNSRR